jgi:DNA-binding beta-propeller fold protein YncE
MWLICCGIVAFVSGTISSASAQTPISVLQLERTIVLPGIVSKFDHLVIDEAGSRLFVAATTVHAVEVIDLKTDKIQQSITGLAKPHGLAWIAATGSLYVSDGALAELRVYKGTPLALAGTIKLSDDADDMAYDATRQLLFVGHGGKDAANPANVAVVDTATFSLKANVATTTHPEGIAVDPLSGRAFANIADTGEISVIDARTKAITAHWKLIKAADNVPLAFDGKGQLLFVACRKPGMLIALDAKTGKEISSQSAAGGADDLFYDPALGRVYLISGAGEVDAFQVDNAKSLHALGVLPTVPGAKTALFVPAQNLLYLAVPGVGDHASEIRVYATVKNGNSQ